jgi:uroporphyrinogen decarboxylase
MSFQPDFRNLLQVLARRRPDRPTLFEYYMNKSVYADLTRGRVYAESDDLASWKQLIDAFAAAGYDYTTITLPGFTFAIGDRGHGRSVSLNEGSRITDRASFRAYPWPDPADVRYDLLDRLAEYLPTGMKLVVPQPVSIFGGTVNLLGFDQLCIMLYEDEALAADVFAAVGERLVAYHLETMQHDSVGACLINDDWGFKQQTRVSPQHLRRYVFPWYRRIVQAAHAAGKPVILHSCGNLQAIMDDIIDDLQFDGKHSYEDLILPVEDAYDRYGARIAILGGIDVDFLCRRSAEEVYARSKAILERSAERGGYALGTGNSVPEYLPKENYYAMLQAAYDLRR